MAPAIPLVIGNWYLLEKLGSGFSGSIFRASHVFTGAIVALKIQDVDNECPTNRYERYLYPFLQGGLGIPTLWASGIHGSWDYLAIDLLGSSLENLFKNAGLDCVDLGTVCSVAIQVITRLEFMHSRGILHRDIQLGNCVVGLPGTPFQHILYMIDFGFSKHYIDPWTKRHIPDSKATRDFIGNYWFSSVGVHCRGKVPSRRDDLESVALMLIHLLTPRGLPWTRNGVPKTESAHLRLIREKQGARPEDLCRGIPPEFEEFLRYCRRLKFMECPDYGRWVDEFRDLAIEEGIFTVDAFVWPPPAPVEKPRPMRANRRTMTSESVEKVLLDLANLGIGDGKRRVLGDRKNIEDAENAKDDVKALEVVLVNSDSSESTVFAPPRPAMRTVPKAAQLRNLTLSMQDAKGNAALADIVTKFVSVLQSNSSRALTKEGFTFLDALYKQLADSDVVVRPLRTSRSRKSADGENEPIQAPRDKLGVLARLRREVRQTSSNKQLAKLVAEFGGVTNKSGGRTVTKDGFAFLEGLASRLKDLHK